VSWSLATLLLALGAAYALWPLVRHWQPEPDLASRPPDLREARLRELEELDLDVAAGRLSEAEAARRRAELGEGRP
jgi:cytochrome c-type biogenesis protein CcmI